MLRWLQCPLNSSKQLPVFVCMDSLSTCRCIWSGRRSTCLSRQPLSQWTLNGVSHTVMTRSAACVDLLLRPKSRNFSLTPKINVQKVLNHVWDWSSYLTGKCRKKFQCLIRGGKCTALRGVINCSTGGGLCSTPDLPINSHPGPICRNTRWPNFMHGSECDTLIWL